MISLQLFFSIGCVVAAAAAAIYFSLPARTPNAHHARRGGNVNSSGDNETDSDRNKLAIRKSKPGDKCLVCLEQMTSESMHRLHCGHALCEYPCFQEYRECRRTCPHCGQIVIRIDVPGDDCSVCCEPMGTETIEYMKCEHAMHRECLQEFRKHFKECPICRRKL